MMENVMETFNQLHESYGTLIANSESIFLALKNKDFSELKRLNFRQVNENEQLVERLEQLGTHIAKACAEYGESEAKISSLLPHLRKEEREEILEHQNRAFHAEKKFKNNAHINQILAEAMMSCSQTIVDTWVHVAQIENKNNAFVNRKL